MTSDTTYDEPAVQLTQVLKSFGFRGRNVPVLSGVDLNMHKGYIYGLLGSSGCGKTTLLKCMIGLVKMDSGSILIFGRRIQSAQCNIPGSDVGYMPQELALFDHLTIHETLTYFGRLHALSKQKIKKQANFLLDLLNLPKEWQLVKNLSGGQKRRVSFAIALLHEPPLLILDEPTVGMDPILRQTIWNHLTEISFTGKVTTIITTHYIEETARAHKIALIRNGKIAAEGEPMELLQSVGEPTLESTILKLCYEDDACQEQQNWDTNMCNDIRDASIQYKMTSVDSSEKSSSFSNLKSKNWCSVPSARRICALIAKNLTEIPRKPLALMTQLLVPGLVISLFCLLFNGHIHNTDVAVVNEDHNFGNIFINHLDNYALHNIPVDNLETAKQMLRDGKIRGWIHIWPNYTSNLCKRFLTQPQNLTDDITNAGTIHINLDKSNLQIIETIQTSLLKSFSDFVGTMKIDLGRESRMNDIFLEFGEIAIRSGNNQFFEFIMPPQVVMILFSLVVSLAVLDCTDDTHSGLVDRNYVAGVGGFELTCSRVVTQILMVTCQVCVDVLCLVVVFNFPCRGNVIWVILLLILQGMCAVAFGNLVSAVFQDQIVALTLGMSAVFLVEILGGLIMPVEVMPDFVGEIIAFSPHTYAIRGVFMVLLEGSGILNFVVFRGVVTSTVWIFIYLFVAVIALKLRY